MADQHRARTSRRRRWRVVLWLATTAGVTAWWAARPEVDLTHVPSTAAVFALLLGAALSQR